MHELVLPDPLWEFTDFEPEISHETLIVHLLQIHKKYVDKLNSWGALNEGIIAIPPSEVLSNLYSYLDEKDKRFYVNNMGGHVSHTLFWSLLNKNPVTGLDSIEDCLFAQDFKLDSEGLKADIINNAMDFMGSGWLWVAIDSRGELRVYCTTIHNTPYMRKQLPLMCIDIWEHAYFLDSCSDRRQWLDSILKYIDFAIVDYIYRSYSDGLNVIDSWCMGLEAYPNIGR